MKAKRKVKPRFKFAYMQDWGTYTDYHTLVAVGMNAEEIEQAARKLIKRKLHIKEVWKSFEDKEEMEKYMACRGWCEWYKGGQSILYIREWGSQEFMDILNHEIVHAVDFFHQHTCMDGMETRAYLQDYLFKSIRERLTKELRKRK